VKLEGVKVVLCFVSAGDGIGGDFALPLEPYPSLKDIFNFFFFWSRVEWLLQNERKSTEQNDK
jgi:hypothetical protein